MALLKLNDHWGALTCTAIAHEQVTRQHNTVTETYWEHFASFFCDCGKRFKLPYREFPGKRKMRDCGCGTAVDIDQANMRVVVTVSLPVGVVNRVKDWATENELSFSAAVGNLCQKALAAGHMPPTSAPVPISPAARTRHSMLGTALLGTALAPTAPAPAATPAPAVPPAPIFDVEPEFSDVDFR